MKLINEIIKNQAIASECKLNIEDIIEYMEKRQVAKQIDLILKSGQRTSEIVKNMLSFVRQGKSKFSSENPVERIEQTIEIASNEYNLKKKYDFRKINIIRKYQKNLPNIMCEKSKIQQVFLNILKNGAEAMYEEKLEFNNNNMPQKSPTFTIGIEAINNTLTFCLGDN